MKIVAISDVHIGAIPADVLRIELKEQFLNKLEDINPDLVVICGDLIDRKLSFNSDDSKLAIEFVEELSKNYKLRILRGTRSHDLNQLSNFNYLENSDKALDTRIFNIMEDEYIEDEHMNEYHILYMPEEYIEDYYEHYSELLSGEYDYAFFHGTWNFAGYVNQLQESERPIKHAPLLDVKKLSHISNLFIGGHIHIHQQFENVYYTGSFSRWIMGEEEAKGFLVINDIEVEFVENTQARKYITLDVNSIVLDESKSVEEKIKYIEDMQNNKDIHKLRVKFDTSSSNNLEATLIKDYFSKSNSIKVDAKNVEKEKATEEENKLTEEYSFIFNREYDMPTTVAMYLKKHDNIELDKKVIESLLLEDE